MLMLRVITAVILLAVLGFAISMGDTSFAIVMGIGFGAVIFEWLKMSGIGPVPAALVAAVEMIASFSLFATGAMDRIQYFLLGLNFVVLLAWMVITVAVLVSRSKGFHIQQRTSLWCAAIFVPATYLSLLYLIGVGSWITVLSVFLIVWLADVSAYFSGRAWGKHKMAVAISPNKTFEGALGAFVITIVFFVLTYIFCDSKLVFTNFIYDAWGFWTGSAILVFLITLSIAGDLWESMLKRLVGIKDSSKLLPGHGGFFDRLDAALPVLPAATFFLQMSLL